jgi:deoxyhypusine synthase
MELIARGLFVEKMKNKSEEPKNKFLTNKVKPFDVTKSKTLADLLEQMCQTGFQGKNLGIAFEIWREMLKDERTILLGLSGAMVPAGMRKVITFLIENRFIDVIVSTGANLFHDIHETCGNFHFQGTPFIDDEKLFEHGVDRIYDVFASEKEFMDIDHYIEKLSYKLSSEKKYTTREYFYFLGGALSKVASEDGILTTAYKNKVPIYCPAFGDSSVGIALAIGRHKGKTDIQFDVIKDVMETAYIISNSPSTGIIFIGGGTPKNYIQQTEVTARGMKINSPGHDYAIQICTDAPHWGGLSGCTFAESTSWGKIATKAKKVNLYADATIALPILAAALAETEDGNKKKRVYPRFTVGEELTFDFK